jgi:hypothetical protein
VYTYTQSLKPVLEHGYLLDWLTAVWVAFIVSNNNLRNGRRGTSKRSSARRNAQNNKSLIVRTPKILTLPGMGFPDSMISHLRYHTQGSLNSVVGAVAADDYRWNSTFDPDQTLGGHQPLYRDTFAVIYDHYSVISATAVVKFVNTSSNVFAVGCVTDDDFTNSTAVDTLCEQTHGKHAMLPALSGSLSALTLRMSWDCKKVLNIDPFTSETYKTAVTSNPAEESSLTMWASDAQGGTNAIYYDITITYKVLWTELSTPTQS